MHACMTTYTLNIPDQWMCLRICACMYCNILIINNIEGCDYVHIMCMHVL